MEANIVVIKVDADPWIAVFAAQANVELFESFGPTASSFSCHYTFSAVVAYLGDEIAGFIIFSKPDEQSVTLDVRLGYVRPAFRRQGLYRKLWDALVAHARTLGIVRIWGGTDIRNGPMRAFWASVGRKEESISGHFYLPKA